MNLLSRPNEGCMGIYHRLYPYTPRPGSEKPTLVYYIRLSNALTLHDDEKQIKLTYIDCIHITLVCITT